jgi:hypothetical protein
MVLLFSTTQKEVNKLESFVVYTAQISVICGQVGQGSVVSFRAVFILEASFLVYWELLLTPEIK